MKFNVHRLFKVVLICMSEHSKSHNLLQLGSDSEIAVQS